MARKSKPSKRLGNNTSKKMKNTNEKMRSEEQSTQARRNESLADNKVKSQDSAVALKRHVHDNDVIGAKRLLVGIDEQNKEMRVAKKQEDNSLPRAAVEQEFQEKYCQVDTEGAGAYDFPLVSHLCFLYASMMETWQELEDADIYAFYDNILSLVKNVCSEEGITAHEFILRQGLNIHKPDDRGETCLMNSVNYSNQSQLSIDNTNAQDNFGNTALHHVIMESKPETAQFLPGKCELEVVTLLQKFGADTNAVSKRSRTPVNEACSSKHIEIDEFLIRQGADIHSPDKYGDTFVHHLELCRILIDDVARMNARDILGNLVLHCAIPESDLETVRILMDHGSNQEMKNNLGHDAQKLANYCGEDSLVMKLVAREEPTNLRLIELQQLLGSFCSLLSKATNAMQALVNWRRSVALRRRNPCVDSREIEQLPVCSDTKEVNTVEELEKLCQNEEMAFMHTLKNFLQLISQSHNDTITGLVRVCEEFSKIGKYSHFFDLWRNSFTRYRLSIHDSEWVNPQDNLGNTALQHAMMESRPETVQFLPGNCELEVVTKWKEFGADTNAASRNGRNPVNETCSYQQIETAELFKRQGAGIKRLDERGETCLENFVPSLEPGKFGNGAHDERNLGNTALYHAITKGDLKTVQLLLDRGSDPNIKNNLGDDALQLASLRGEELIVKELEFRQKPALLRLIESQLLLGANCFFSKAGNVRLARPFWEESVQLQMQNPGVELRKIEPSPVCSVAMEVKTLKKLNAVCRNQERLHMFILQSLLRIIGPSRKETTDALVCVSKVFSRNGKDKRCFDLLKYAFVQLHERTPTWTEQYVCVLDMLYACLIKLHKSKFKMNFRDVFEILDKVSVKWQDAEEVHSYSMAYSMQLILWFVLFIEKLDKGPDQIILFKKAVHRLVRRRVKEGVKDIRDEEGRTFLHRAVEQRCLYQGVAEFLLECGADVNALDAHNNTALHLCTRQKTSFGSVFHEETKKVIKLLLRYSAHIDIVNDSGDIAAKGLSLNMLDHVSLKCLATAVIRDYQIPYLGQIPESLESFVQMHGRCPSKKLKE